MRRRERRASSACREEAKFSQWFFTVQQQFAAEAISGPSVGNLRANPPPSALRARCRRHHAARNDRRFYATMEQYIFSPGGADGLPVGSIRAPCSAPAPSFPSAAGHRDAPSFSPVGGSSSRRIDLMADRQNRAPRRDDERSVPPHVHQQCFTYPNPNRSGTLSLGEEDLDNIAFLRKYGLVADEELGSFTPPSWNEHEVQEVQQDNKGLTTNYNNWILYRRRYYRLIAKGRFSTADAEAIMVKIKGIRKEVNLLIEKIGTLHGRAYKIPDVLQKEMKLKEVGSSSSRGK